jgi:hypothetical protein
MVYDYLKKAGYPVYAVGYSVCIVKPFFAFLFVLEDRLYWKKRVG